VGGYEVDPARLDASGKTVGAQGDALINALGALDSALSGSGLMCGTDDAGLAFFIDYRKGGQALLSAAESAVNAFRNVGYGVEVSAHNYALSDAVSTVGGGRESIPVPAEPTKYTASGLSGQSGPEIPPPSLWSMVQPFVGGMWPNGSPDTMRTVAGAWRTLGAAISTASGDAGGCLSMVSDHDIPELGHITDALNTLTSGTSELAGKCNSIAEKLDSFAGEVQRSQDAIRDLLHRLSPSGILGEIGGILAGHNPIDDLKAIGHDISEILHTLSRELDSAASAFQMLIDGMDGLVREFEEWDRKEFTRFFGNQVGNVMADGVNGYADIEEGVAKSVLEVGQSIPTMLAHPVDTVKGVWEIDKNMAEFFNPLGPMFDRQGQMEAGEHLLDTVKGVVDYKDWTSDRPLVGLGDNIGNIAQVLIPGAGEAKAGVMGGKAGEEAAQVARAEGAGVRGGLRAVEEAGGKQIADQAGKIGKDLDGLATKPVDAPKTPEPVSRPASDGAAGGNSGGGKAPVDAGARPGGESAPASHEPATAPHGGEPHPGGPHSSGATPHDGGVQSPAGTHAPAEPGAGAPRDDGSHQPVPAHAHASTGEATTGGAATHEAATPGSAAPHQAPAPHEMADAHSGGHGGGDHGDGSHGGGGDHGGGDSHDAGHGDGGPSGGGHGDTGSHGALPPKLEGHDYGFSPENAFEHSIDRESEIARLQEGGVPASVTDGYEPLAGRTESEFKHEFTITDEHGRMRWDWDNQAPNNGFAGPPSVSDHIPQGQHLDRLGSNDGGFMADEGAPLSTRAMPPGIANDYHTFEGTGRSIPDGLNWEVQYGPAKDAFGQPGGANQWAVIDRDSGRTVSVEELIRKRLIRETTPER
jgi:Tuberculosis necrotizing toxin